MNNNKKCRGEGNSLKVVYHPGKKITMVFCALCTPHGFWYAQARGLRVYLNESRATNGKK